MRNDDGDLELVGIRWRGSPWAKAKLRKPTTCWRCEKQLAVGEKVFRPMDNSMIRMNRLCLECAEYLARRGG